jgi:hypothetical protein
MPLMCQSILFARGSISLRIGTHRFRRFQREFVPVPRPLAGARARARFNNAKEAEEHVNNQEFEPTGPLNESKRAGNHPMHRGICPLACHAACLFRARARTRARARCLFGPLLKPPALRVGPHSSIRLAMLHTLRYPYKIPTFGFNLPDKEDKK